MLRLSDILVIRPTARSLEGISQVKNIFAFLVIVLLGMSATRSALAAPVEDAGPLAIPTPVADDSPVRHRVAPGNEMPELPGLPELPDSLDPDGQPPANADYSANSLPEPIASGEADLLEPEAEGDEYSIFDLEPALLESTGTWLRRGFWYTEVDVVILNREINKRNFFPLMHQTNALTRTQLGIPVVVDNFLAIAGDKPSVEAMPRIKIGRFLFRDLENRDHTAEFVWFGGGQWEQQGALTATGETLAGGDPIDQNLQVPIGIGGENPSFNGATSSRYDYASRFNSFELNYHLKRRLHRDKMIMQPDGEWVRAASPTLTRTFLTGLRYFELNDDLLWNAYDVPIVDDQGNPVDDGVGHNGLYRVRTKNGLFGMQIGTSFSYETARWSLGALGKGGLYLDKMTLNSNFSNTNLDTGGRTNTSDDALSFLLEARLQGKWHLRPNFSFRAGAELLYVKSVALAPWQVNFIPGDYPTITTAVSPTASSEQYNLFMGFSAGFEGYW